MAVILLSLLIISLVFKDLVTYAHFHLNRNYIAEFLCVNRFKPDTLCHGKCYLKKSIKKQQEQEKKIPNPINEKKTSIVFFSKSKSDLFDTQIKKKKKELIYFLEDNYSFSYLKEIFHPPQLT